MTIHFWGTRGSHPVSGPAFSQFGGNTHCLQVTSGNHHVIFDAGTGIVPLGYQLAAQLPQQYSLFISHLHLDHLIGLPFFAPLSESNSHLEIWIPDQETKKGKEIISSLFSPPYFPIPITQFPAPLTFHSLSTQDVISVGDIKIWTYPAVHPGHTLCYKIQVGKTIFGLVTDNEFLQGYTDTPSNLTKDHFLMQAALPLIDFFTGCDFLIHEAQYFSEEYITRIGWGHTSIINGAILMREAKIKKWIVTHHAPHHTDKMLQQKLQIHQDVLKTNHIPCEVIFAYDGLEYIL